MPESWLVVRANSRHGCLGLALGADGLGVLDLLDRGPGGADGEEEVGVGVSTGRDGTPVIGAADRDNERDVVRATVPPRIGLTSRRGC